jgi:hypothetical protein
MRTLVSASKISSTYRLSGHNMNLGNANEGTVEYGDQSGIMVRFDT